MNATSEDSRSGRRGNDPKATGQQRQSAASRDGTPNSQQSRRGGRSGPALSRHTESPQNGPGSTHFPLQEDHVSLPGFSADHLDSVLKQGFEPKAALHKPEAKTQSARSESPWGAKPGAMANGKDFWLELRKQVTALQQTGGTSQGG